MKKSFFFILLILLLIMTGVAYYFYDKSAGPDNIYVAHDKSGEPEEVALLVERVGKLILLPAGETPTVATVSDPEKLKDQPFFAKAKAGDKVLIYSQAGKAYLYDPVINQVLEVAPINLNPINPQAGE